MTFSFSSTTSKQVLRRPVAFGVNWTQQGPKAETLSGPEDPQLLLALTPLSFLFIHISPFMFSLPFSTPPSLLPSFPPPANIGCLSTVSQVWYVRGHWEIQWGGKQPRDRDADYRQINTDLKPYCKSQSAGARNHPSDGLLFLKIVVKYTLHKIDHF